MKPFDHNAPAEPAAISPKHTSTPVRPFMPPPKSRAARLASSGFFGMAALLIAGFLGWQIYSWWQTNAKGATFDGISVFGFGKPAPIEPPALATTPSTLPTGNVSLPSRQVGSAQRPTTRCTGPTAATDPTCNIDPRLMQAPTEAEIAARNPVTQTPSELAAAKEVVKPQTQRLEVGRSAAVSKADQCNEMRSRVEELDARALQPQLPLTLKGFQREKSQLQGRMAGLGC